MTLKKEISNCSKLGKNCPKNKSVSKRGKIFSKNAYSSKLGETLFPSIFKGPKSFASSFFSISLFSPQFSIYRKFLKCFKALIGDMFVKDFQLGENCHKTKSVSKLAKNSLEILCFFSKLWWIFSISREFRTEYSFQILEIKILWKFIIPWSLSLSWPCSNHIMGLKL